MHASKAFSLIELMVAVAIVAILATIAVPRYTDYVMKGNRSDAIETLQAIMDGQERYYLDNSTYTNDLSKLGLTLNSGFYITPRKYYKVKADKCGSDALTLCVELTAIGQGSQADDGKVVFNSRNKKVHIKGSTVTNL